jgi:hypothetical protein
MASHLVQHVSGELEKLARVINRLKDRASADQLNEIAKCIRQFQAEIGSIGSVADSVESGENDNVESRASHGFGTLFPDAIEEKQQQGRQVPTDEEFEAFYRAFPRKVNKAKSKIAFAKAFKTLRKKHDPETVIKTIMVGVDVYVSKANPDALCHPTTWLNGERWDDDPDSIGSPTLSRPNRGRDVKTSRYGTFDENEPVLSVEEAIRKAKL